MLKIRMVRDFRSPTRDLDNGREFVVDVDFDGETASDLVAGEFAEYIIEKTPPSPETTDVPHDEHRPTRNRKARG